MKFFDILPKICVRVVSSVQPQVIVVNQTNYDWRLRFDYNDSAMSFDERDRFFDLYKSMRDRIIREIKRGTISPNEVKVFTDSVCEILDSEMGEKVVPFSFDRRTIKEELGKLERLSWAA